MADETYERRVEKEADRVVADVDDYVVLTAPETLPQAEEALESWQVPAPPLEGLSASGSPVANVDDIPLVSIFSARSESEANIVKGLLESEGIAVILHEVATPVYGSIFSVSEARWADLLVANAEAEQAKAMIDIAMKATIDAAMQQEEAR